jgi:tetratricopeptide (TPR) repeat protein
MSDFDFNYLEKAAHLLKEKSKINEALEIYYYMADGDPSLDGGYLGMRIGECYELMGNYNAAKFWYGRAVEENPEVEIYQQKRSKLEKATLTHILKLIE